MPDQDEVRPSLDDIQARSEFDRWYWPVDVMRAFCKVKGVPAGGRKAELRARLAAWFEGKPVALKTVPKRKTQWSKAVLTPDTLIDADITFGRNVRGFFADHIGKSFTCTSEFMAWVKANSGQPLSAAIVHWRALEARKADPEFRRDIDPCNNYLLYLRALRDAHPDLSLDEAKAIWHQKSRRPAKDGFVVYDPLDLELA